MSEPGDTVRRKFYEGQFEVTYIPQGKEGETKEEIHQRHQINRQAEYDMRLKVKAELEAAFGLTQHPKKDAAWRLAWEERHSSGYLEIIDLYEDLAELMI